MQNAVLRFIGFVLGFLNSELSKKIVLGEFRLRLGFVLGYIYRKCGKVIVYCDPRARNKLGSFLYRLLLRYRLRLGLRNGNGCRLGNALLNYRLRSSFHRLRRSKLRFGSGNGHRFFGFRRLRTGDPCRCISERNYSLIGNAHFFTLLFLLEQSRHFLFIGFYDLFCKIRLTLFAGYLFQIRHCACPAVSCNIICFQQVDPTARFLVIFGTVN